jgi:hypothetical protein
MTKSQRQQDAEDIAKAYSVPLPGGVRLTTEEQELRDQKTMSLTRAGIVARSILRKVAAVCAGES